MKYNKVERELKFKRKRNAKLITPCCKKTNKDGKFVNYEGFEDHFGYCHSCGKTNHPPTIYRDEFGNEFMWDKMSKSFKESVTQITRNNSICNTTASYKRNTHTQQSVKYIDFKIVTLCYNKTPENNLLSYLRNTYGNTETERVKKLYHIGTNKNGGAVFWAINKDMKVQKAKVCYYNKNGNRTNFFKVPYQKADGYHSCLFGEHLLSVFEDKPIFLVESEKTAIICAITFPKYNWLAYGGINGMTDEKMKVLAGREVVIIPDISENAISIATKKVKKLKKLTINASVLDLSNENNDIELKEIGIYNFDIEDLLRS